MSRKWKIGMLLFLCMGIIITTPFLGRMETKYFSAYASCRDNATATKGYAIWKHKNTNLAVFSSVIVFSDGTNDLTCQAIGVGPFWIAVSTYQTIVGCAPALGDTTKMCIEDYFGVYP